MPDGIGKLKDKLQARFPRTSGFLERYHTTLSVVAIIGLVSLVAYIGVSQHHTESVVTHVQGDVNVIKQQSSCAPRANGEPKRPRRCRESFHTIIHKILTPLEACEFLERGAPVIRVGGKPMPDVECVQPDDQSASRSPGEHKEQTVMNPGESTTGGIGPRAPEHQSTSGNPNAGGGHPVAPGTHHGSHHGSGNPAPAPTPTPEVSPAPEGPGASGGAGKSEESHASEHAEETPAPAAGNKPLPGVVGAVESTVCGAPVAGKVVCE